MSDPQLQAILITGAPATGKSTVGRLVAGALRAALLDQDVVTGPLVEAVGANSTIRPPSSGLDAWTRRPSRTSPSTPHRTH